MRTSILFLVLFSISSALATGCMPSTTKTIGFEPRSYPYLPQLGLPDGPSGTGAK
jgi:hypothetical protein